MSFPKVRMRDRRKDERTRKSFREMKNISVKDLIMPVFVKEGINKKVEVKSMPGIYQFGLKDIAGEAKKIYRLGIPSAILFGMPRHKDDVGSAAYNEKGIVQEAIRAVKRSSPKLSVIADVCMCEYTSHGHCGIIKRQEASSGFARDRRDKRQDYRVDNDETIKILARIAVSYARAGVDIVAPSAMMDGQVKAIKEALSKYNYPNVKILAYSAKYASNLYGPFRDAAESPPKFGDRKTYQMDYHNSDEAILEARLDIEEGADMLMANPAPGYEDIIYRLTKELAFPIACYSVSGEYAMIKAASVKGYIDEKKTVLELLAGFKLSGADKLHPYSSREPAGGLKI